MNNLKIYQLFLLGIIALLIAFFCNCAPAVKTETLSSAYSSKPPDCDMIVYSIEAQIPEEAETLGTISIKDTGLSVKCDYYTVLNLAKAEACNLGADVIKLTEIKEPSFWGSSCYQIKAVALAIEDPQIELTKRKIGEPDEWQLASLYLNDCYPYRTDYRLIGHCAGNEVDETYLVLYVVATRSDVFPIYRYDKWYDLTKAEDVDGNILEIHKLRVQMGDIYAEYYKVAMGKEYLESHREKPIQLSLTGEGGEIKIDISPRDINGFLNGLADHLENQ